MTAPMPKTGAYDEQTLAGAKAAKLNLGAISWAICQGARDCYLPLILNFIFFPYFSTVVIGDPVRAQETISRWSIGSSVIIMFTAPLLGSSIDQLGRRKNAVALLVAIMTMLDVSLWWTRPDGSGLGIIGTLAIITITTTLFCYLELLHNSLLVRASGLANAHKASGLGSGLSMAMSVVLLIICLWAFVLPGTVTWPWIPWEPLLGLKTSLHEPERIVGPLTGLVLLLGSLPLFLFTPDAQRTGRPFFQAVRNGARNLVEMARTVHLYRDPAVFLAARMFFVDGMSTLLLYLGIYASGVMHWGAFEMLVLGILVSAFGALGGLIGASLDKFAGPKRALQIEICMSFLGIVALLGMAPDHILYVPYGAAHPALWNGPVFRTLPECMFVIIVCCNTAAVVAHYASGRTMMTRLAPPEHMGTFFGFFALSGTATLWLGSLMVTLGTSLFHSQRAGFAGIALLLVIGFVGLLFVRGGGRLAPAPVATLARTAS